VAWASERFTNTPAVGSDEKILNTRLGWAAGAGVEYGFAPDWSVKLEYLYSRYGDANIRFPSGTQYNSTLNFQSLRVGLNRKIDWPGGSSLKPKTDLTDTESDRWEIHGQSTFLAQGYPSFRALYTGPNSLTPARQLQETWSNSLYLNARLWDGGEVYYNPELLQGFGLNDTVGLGGFSSGEAQNSGLPTKQGGVMYRTRDGGRSWQRAEISSPSLHRLVRFGVPQFFGSDGVVAGWINPTGVPTAHEDVAVYVTHDGGDTWTKLTGGLPGGSLGRIGLDARVGGTGPAVRRALP